MVVSQTTWMESIFGRDVSKTTETNCVCSWSGDTDWFGEGVGMNVYERKKRTIFSL